MDRLPLCRICGSALLDMQFTPVMSNSGHPLHTCHYSFTDVSTGVRPDLNQCCPCMLNRVATTLPIQPPQHALVGQACTWKALISFHVICLFYCWHYEPVMEWMTVCLQVNLDITPGALKAIAHLAMERKTGARGLRAIMVCHTRNIS